MRNWRTTLIGVLSILATIIYGVLLYFKIVEVAEGSVYFLGALGFIQGVSGLIGKDYNVDTKEEIIKTLSSEQEVQSILRNKS